MTDDSLPRAERERQAERYAQSAVEMLRKAQATGFFRVPGNLELLRKDTDLDPLRQRKDFRKLLEEVTEGKAEGK